MSQTMQWESFEWYQKWSNKWDGGKLQQKDCGSVLPNPETARSQNRLQSSLYYYERLWTVLTCGMAVMEARMTRTKRDVSVGIHSSSHGHEIMSDFASPGPLGTKQRALRLLFHNYGRRCGHFRGDAWELNGISWWTFSENVAGCALEIYKNGRGHWESKVCTVPRRSANHFWLHLMPGWHAQIMLEV